LKYRRGRGTGDSEFGIDGEDPMEMEPRLFIATHFYDTARDDTTPGALKRGRRTARLATSGGASTRAAVWSFENKIEIIPERVHVLRVETRAPAMIHWTSDGWRTTRDDPTWEVRSGVHVADLAIPSPPIDRKIRFTFYWPGADRWEGSDFTVLVEESVGRPGKSRTAGELDE
jgi:hypothetical protein